MESASDKTVYFVRHGQSVDNPQPIFQSVNSPLSEEGTEQAVTIANRLSTVEFDVLIASPVLRAKDTAQHIADVTRKEIIFSDLFVERVKPSEIDGKPWSDPSADKLWRAWEETLYSPGARVSDGENYDDTIERVDNALEFLLRQREQRIVVVTHGYFLRAIIARVLLGDELNGTIMNRFQQRVSTENTAVTVLTYSAANPTFEEGYHWRLLTLNDHSHFAE